MQGITEEDLQRVEAFLSQSLTLNEEEIQTRLGALAAYFLKKPQVPVAFIFWQLERDVEVTFRIVREYLMQKVLSKDISDVPLADLQKVWPLLTSKKRQVNNTYYQGLFAAFKKEKLPRQEQKFITEAEKRLPLFIQFQNSIKEVLEVHIDILKLFASVSITQEPTFQELSFLPMLDDMINGSSEAVADQVKYLTPALKQPRLLDTETYERLMKLYLSELELDLVQFEQIARWKKATQNPAQREYILKVEKKLLQLQRMHRGVLFIAYSSKQDIEKKLLSMREFTYTLEKMIDSFKL